MDVRKFESMVAKKEGKKSQTSIGNVREIVKIIFDLALKNKKVRKYVLKRLGAIEAPKKKPAKKKAK